MKKIFIAILILFLVPTSLIFIWDFVQDEFSISITYNHLNDKIPIFKSECLGINLPEIFKKRLDNYSPTHYRCLGIIVEGTDLCRGPKDPEDYQIPCSSFSWEEYFKRISR
jgi:hypothetical protein